MQGKKWSHGFRSILTIFTGMLFATGAWSATHEQVLHNFGGTDGANPYSGLVADAAGNLYGTTGTGGIHGNGTVFELMPREGGGWTEKVLHSFDGADGAFPDGDLIFDAAGNLYGVTGEGGIHFYGTVFELTPREDGSWTEKVLHSFDVNGVDGAFPDSGLVADAAGNLYGTTSAGGIYGSCGQYKCGTVFELTPAEDGIWTEKVLHSFNLNGQDGAYPEASLIIDLGGNLYGTTWTGGIHYLGTAFELSPTEGGGWAEKVLHSFGNGDDGASPGGGLTFDAAGNLYGTTGDGGIHHDGTVFELTPRQGGGWAEKVLHSFGNGTDGISPAYGSLTFDAAGNLYGTTSGGGIHGYGTAFKLTPQQGGEWQETILHSFGNGTDGAVPEEGLIFDAAGNLYSTTTYGGIHDCDDGPCGTAFEITP